jgi:hypothetical protein
MRTLRIRGASPNPGEAAESVTVLIDNALASCWERPLETGETITEIADFYAAEARELYNVLRSSLPQGTLHALLVEMLRGAPSLHRGPAPKVRTAVAFDALEEVAVAHALNEQIEAIKHWDVSETEKAITRGRLKRVLAKLVPPKEGSS